MSFLWNPPEKVVPQKREGEEMFDIFFALTILVTMYISWYSGKAPSGVSVQWHALAVTAATYLVAFFVYFMVAEAPLRPQYHKTLILIWYCAVALTYATLYYRGCIEERNKLRDN